MEKLGDVSIISIRTESASMRLSDPEYHFITVDHELNQSEIRSMLDNLYFGPAITGIKKNDNETWTYTVKCYKD